MPQSGGKIEMLLTGSILKTIEFTATEISDFGLKDDKGGIVLDPFMGSGTTAVVARKLNRNYVGFELNPDYVKIAERKLNRELGLFV